MHRLRPCGGRCGHCRSSRISCSSMATGFERQRASRNTDATSRGMRDLPPSLRRAFWPKPTGMPTCWSYTQPSRSMGGMPMRAIRRSNTARPSGSTGQRPITVHRSVSCLSRWCCLPEQQRHRGGYKCNYLRTVELRKCCFYPHNALICRVFSSLRNQF